MDLGRVRLPCRVFAASAAIVDSFGRLSGLLNGISLVVVSGVTNAVTSPRFNNDHGFGHVASGEVGRRCWLTVVVVTFGSSFVQSFSSPPFSATVSLEYFCASGFC